MYILAGVIFFLVRASGTSMYVGGAYHKNSPNACESNAWDCDGACSLAKRYTVRKHPYVLKSISRWSSDSNLHHWRRNEIILNSQRSVCVCVWERETDRKNTFNQNATSSQIQNIIQHSITAQLHQPEPQKYCYWQAEVWKHGAIWLDASKVLFLRLVVRRSKG
jgi:hypothetical protein